MAEEMKNQETMDVFAKEIDASFESFRDADMDIWEKLEKMKEDKTEFDVTIEGIVKGGAIAYVEGICAFIPVSKLSLQYVEDPEEFLKKTLTVRVFDVNEEENNLVLSAREVLREKRDAEKREKIADIKVGTVLDGTVETPAELRRFRRPGRRYLRPGPRIPDQPEKDQISKSRIIRRRQSDCKGDQE